MTDTISVDNDSARFSSERGRAALKMALGRYFGQMWTDRWLATPALLFPALGNVLLFYVPPLIVATILTRADDEAFDLGALTPQLIWFAVVWIGGEICWRIGIHFLNRTDAKGIEALANNGMDDLLAKDAVFFHDNFAGSLTKRLVSYANRYEGFVDTLAFQIVGNVVPLLFACIVLFRFSPWLVVALIGMLCVTAAVIVPLIRRRQVLVHQREAASAAVAGHVADTITNMEAVRSHAAEAEEAGAHQRNVARHRRLNLKSWDFHNLYIDGAASPLAVGTNVLGLVLAIQLAGPNRIETVFVTFTYFAQATKIVFEFNQIYRNLESAATEGAQFTELLLDDPTVLDPTDPVALAPRDASVQFEHVRFTHGDASTGLFDDLDLRVASGEKIGLVGRSGGGKTTLTRLLLRLVDIDGGRILVGGQDIQSIRQRDLRSQIAYVPQDPVMFHRTLRENIAFGRPTATEDEIIAAAKAAHAHDFIGELSHGYETLVGERGIKLSGGQRQRVAIARAILRDAPILVLDEATSALDSDSEAMIQEALLELMRDRTALVVAHRLSTVQALDRLVVIEDGDIIEQGTHAELVDTGGMYANLWHRQSGGFIIDEPVP